MTLRRPKKPGARAHLQRTEAQERAFRVFRLRGLYCMAYALTGERRAAALALIDAEIESLGAESETARADRRRREFEERWAREDAAAADLERELPF